MGWGASTRQVSADRLESAANILRDIIANPNRGIPDEILKHAKCVAVVPHIVKGGFVFGAEEGRGVATCRTEEEWSAPSFFLITGGNWGLQIGREGVDLVMVFQGEGGMEHLLGGKFEIGGDASVAAGPVGRHASADTDWKLNTEILTYARVDGALEGLTLKGSMVSVDEDSMSSIYSNDVTVSSVLEGRVSAPPQAHSFLASVRDTQHRSQSEGQPSEPPTSYSRSTAREFLFDSAKEEPGFGLYSYLLFAEQPDDNSKLRYLPILKEFLRLNRVEDQREWTLDKMRLNITYIPLRDKAKKSAETATADQLITPDNYNYARSKSLLDNLPGDQLKRVRPYGIYLVSVLRPLSLSPVNDRERILVEDLTSVPPEVAAVWIEHFKVQAAQADFWEEDSLEKFGLGLRTVIAEAAVAVDPSKRALSDWQDILASLIFWKGKK